MRATQSSSDFFLRCNGSSFLMAFCRAILESFATWTQLSLKYLTPLTMRDRVLVLCVPKPTRTIEAIELTDKAVVSCHFCPFFRRMDSVEEIHCLVCLELAAGRKGRHLQVDVLGCVIFLTVLGAPALLLFLVLGVGDLDSKGVFGPAVLGLNPGPSPRGYHGCGMLRLGAP